MINRCLVALLCSISARALPCALADIGSLQTHVLGLCCPLVLVAIAVLAMRWKKRSSRTLS